MAKSVDHTSGLCSRQAPHDKSVVRLRYRFSDTTAGIVDQHASLYMITAELKLIHGCVRHSPLLDASDTMRTMQAQA